MLLGYWFQEAIPAELNWFVAILGIIAFVLALLAMPSVAQMLWGKAQLQTEYHTDANGEDRSLIVFLSNPPVKHKLLKRIGVRRVAVQSVEAAFSISEAGSGMVMDPVRHARFSSTDGASDNSFSDRIFLPPTYSVGASMMVALWDKTRAEAVVFPDRLRPAMPLGGGLYQIEIIFQVDGEPLREVRRFKVGRIGDDLMWIEAKH